MRQYCIQCTWTKHSKLKKKNLLLRPDYILFVKIKMLFPRQQNKEKHQFCKVGKEFNQRRYERVAS